MENARRTSGDAIKAAHCLMAFAINKKGWDKVELTGLDTMVNRAAVTAILLNVAVLRYIISERCKKIIEMTRLAHPAWFSSGPGSAPAA